MFKSNIFTNFASCWWYSTGTWI